jgi:hypothetical protein
MARMIRRFLWMVGSTWLLAASSLAAERHLGHRVWLLGGVPDAVTVGVLRAAGVQGFCLPAGKVEIGDSMARFQADLPSNLSALSGTTVSAVVWVEGDLRRGGDPARFVVQLGAVEGRLPGSGSLILVAKSFGGGLPEFAMGVAEKLRRPVELALPAAALAAHLPVGGWRGVQPLAVAFGNPPALGLPASTVQDDRLALEAVDSRGVPYRVAIVVAPLTTPAPGPGGGSLAMLTRAGVSAYRPGSRGDVFVLQRSLDWGGVLLAPKVQVEVEAFDTARFDRDLAQTLRPVRPGLEGWDTVGLPSPEPAIGLSREAFVDYLRGGGPSPRPVIETSWVGNKLLLTLSNPTPHGSAVSSTGNWLQLNVLPGQVADARVGEFDGLEFGRLEGGVLRSTVLREAAILRFYVSYLAPQARIGGASVSFLGRASELRCRWGVRLGDGREVTGEGRITPL